jgi:flavin reductase (DIM6/NTAB) family NADH-FMN oxidoreductase RutF
VDSSLEPHHLFATTVALLTSQTSDGRRSVMACEWTMNVSWRPLRIMSLVHSSDFSHELITASGEFGVNLCSDTQAELSHIAGSSSGRDVDKLADPAFVAAIYPAARIRAPMMRGCVLSAECILERCIEFGEYTAFVGRAVAVRANPQANPLLYHRARYFGMGAAIPKPLLLPLPLGEGRGEGGVIG